MARTCAAIDSCARLVKPTGSSVRSRSQSSKAVPTGR